MRLCAKFIVGMALLAGSAVQAGTVQVTDSNLQGWVPGTVRDGATAGIESFTDDLGGNGALEFYMPAPSGNSPKAEWEIYGDFGLLSDLTHLSYSWFRDGSSGNPPLQVPVVRLIVHDIDFNALSYLIYEPAYNGGLFAVDTWHTTPDSDTTTGTFWAWKTGVGGGSVDVYTTIDDYINGTKGVNDAIGTNARVVGFNIGVGSGWNGEFLGYVDHLSYGFGGTEVTTWDFATNSAVVPVPAAAPLALLGMGIVGLAARRSRKKS